MEYIAVIIIAAAVFGLCWLIDKGWTRLFRSQAQHYSGLSVRLNKKFGSFGLIFFVLGVVALFTGLSDESTVLIAGGIVVMLLGIGLAIYYMFTGIFYDEDTFLCSSFGRKSRAYRYEDILHQKLYTVQGGSLIIELHMTDGSAVQVLSQMSDYDAFLSHAHQRWCARKGLDPQAYPYDPANSIWFPNEEEI